jgi:hypothetical protein
MQNPFFVVSACAGYSLKHDGAKRTFLATEGNAADYAGSILRQQAAPPGAKLFIAKVIGVVEVPAQPLTARKPTASDDV